MPPAKADAEVRVGRFQSLREELAAVLVINHAAEVDPASTPQALVLDIDLKYRGTLALLSKILPFRKRKGYLLTGLGLEIYSRIDGKKTVEDHIEWFMRRYHLSFFEARGVLINYLSMLLDRGLVVVAQLKNESRDPIDGSRDAP